MSLKQINVNNTLVTGVDEEPIAGSKNLVESAGTSQKILEVSSKIDLFNDLGNDRFRYVKEVYLTSDCPSNGTIYSLKHQTLNSNVFQFVVFENNKYVIAQAIANANFLPFSLTVYHSQDDNYPIGTIIAYVVFSDYQSFIDIVDGGSNPNNVNYKAASNINNAPTIDSYLHNIKSKQIADNAIISSKIADNAIISSKIADNAIISSKIADNAIISSKIADYAINENKIQLNIISYNHLDESIKEDFNKIESSYKNFISEESCYKTDITVISGYGFVIGENIKRLYKIGIKIGNREYNDSTEDITKIRFTLYKDYYNGEILTDKTITLDTPIPVGDSQIVECIFDKDVSYSGIVYFIFRTNHYVSRFQTDKTYPYTPVKKDWIPSDEGYYPRCGYTINGQLTGFSPNSGGLENTYCIYYTRDILLNSEKLDDTFIKSQDLIPINEEINEINQYLFHDYLNPKSTFLSENGITSSTELKSFMKSFKMLTQREEGYDYGIYKVNNGQPEGTNYKYSIICYKFPTGQTINHTNATIFCRKEWPNQPQSGKIYLPLETNKSVNAAIVDLDWSALNSEFGGGSWFNGIGTGVIYNQEVIFNDDLSVSDHLESLDQEIIDINTRIDDIASPYITISVPDVIYAVVGDTLQLFYRGIFTCVEPYRYDINVICNIGSQFPRYFEVTPSNDNIGNHNITFTIKDENNNILGTKTTILRVVDIIQEPVNNLGILFLGASCTAGGWYPLETKRRLTQSGGTPLGSNLSNFTFVGRKTFSSNGLTVNYEATGGFNYDSYLRINKLYVFDFTATSPCGTVSMGDIYSDGTNNYTISEINLTNGIGNISCESSIDSDISGAGTLTVVSGTGSQTLNYTSSSVKGNPFVYNGVIDIARYAEIYGSFDIVIFELSCNGTSSYMTDFTNLFTSMMSLINKLKEYKSTIKFIVGTNWENDVIGGMGTNYHATGGWSLRYGRTVTNHNMLNELQKYIKDNNLSDYVYICNLLNEFDCEAGYPRTTKNLNIRSTLTEPFGTNGNHPIVNGYYQWSDTTWRLLVAKFCQ